VIRVVLADDQALVRGGFRMILRAERDIEVVAEAGDGEEAVAAVRRTRPDVVLMDVRMPNVDGLEATRRIVAGEPDPPRILMLTTFDLDEYVYEALRAGASGFLLKEVPPEQLAAAVRTIAAGESLLAPSVTRRMIERFTAEPLPRRDPLSALGELTARERQVLQMIARAMTNREIASELILGEATIKTHVARIYMKLGLRDRVHAVVFAYENGLV
jgi:DNA-binding NarL/FixJ family response regulator